LIDRDSKEGVMAKIEEAERDVIEKWLVWSADRPRLTGHDVEPR
jgi:hypothetical protein